MRGVGGVLDGIVHLTRLSCSLAGSAVEAKVQLLNRASARMQADLAEVFRPIQPPQPKKRTHISGHRTDP
jgi:hypothetical protein